ncbi:MAG: hypothetical protein Q9217_002905 [Psora testacea]
MKVRPEEPRMLGDFKLFPSAASAPSNYAELRPLINRLPSSHLLKSDRNGLIKAFDKEETTLCATRPGLKYGFLLKEAYMRLSAAMSLPRPSEAEAAIVGGSDEFGMEEEQVLYTAHGLKSDLVPAKAMAITSAWIARGDGAGGPGTQLEEVQSQDKVAFTWHFETMSYVADAAEVDFSAK